MANLDSKEQREQIKGKAPKPSRIDGHCEQIQRRRAKAGACPEKARDGDAAENGGDQTPSTVLVYAS